MYSIPACPYSIAKNGGNSFLCTVICKHTMKQVEKIIQYVLHSAYHIDIDTNGILVYWTIGVFIEYCEAISNVDEFNILNSSTLKMYIIASVTIVMKFCHEDGEWQSSSSIAFNTISDDTHSISDFLKVEIDMLIKIDLIKCFENHCPDGYALTNLTFIKIDSDEKKNNTAVLLHAV
jgi:hypothetical protein